MISEKIKELRMKAGHTQQSLADATGVSPAFICRVERGNRKPPVWLLASIERALSLEPGTLDAEYSKRRAYADQLYQRRTHPSRSSTVGTPETKRATDPDVQKEDQGLGVTLPTRQA